MRHTGNRIGGSNPSLSAIDFIRQALRSRANDCDELTAMTTVEDFEKAVAELPHDQHVRFRAWFEELEAARFDQRIERGMKAGRLDRLADQALADFRAGRAREL
jgi:predicted secreted Zn-dependent protease